MSDLKNYVETRLLRAGRTMVMLPAVGTSPKQFGNGWPEYITEFSDLIGAPKEMKIPMPRATMKQMDDYEEVSGWIIELAKYCKAKRMPYVSRALTLRILIHPISEKHIFTWTRLGKVMGGHSPTTAQNWYNQGLDKLVTLNGAQIEKERGYSEFMEDTFDSAYHGF